MILNQAKKLLFLFFVFLSVLPFFFFQHETPRKIVFNQRKASLPLSEIPHWHLFGKINPVSNHSALYTLVGIFKSQTEKPSQVILRLHSGVEKNFVIGNTLPDGKIIRAIFDDAILLEGSQGMEELEFSFPHLDQQRSP